MGGFDLRFRYSWFFRTFSTIILAAIWASNFCAAWISGEAWLDIIIPPNSGVDPFSNCEDNCSDAPERFDNDVLNFLVFIFKRIW